MTTITDHQLRVLPVDDINPSTDNLRQDLGDLDQLVASINAVGIIEPLVVTWLGDDGWLIVAGHRRLEAARRAGLDTVPCYVRDDLVDDALRTEAMLVENLVRVDLNPVEEAVGYGRLVDLGLTQRQIAERVGCDQSHVSKRLLLLTLPDAAHPMIVDGRLLVADALQLAKLNKLDAASAAEWLAEPNRWPGVVERIRRAENDQRVAAARAEGEASGLPEWVDGWHRHLTSSDQRTDSSTHWQVTHTGNLIWLTNRADTEPTDVDGAAAATPQAASKPAPPPKEDNWQRERDIKRKAISDRLVEWFGGPGAADATSIAIAYLDHALSADLDLMVARPTQIVVDNRYAELTPLNRALACILFWELEDLSEDDQLSLANFIGIDLSDDLRDRVPDPDPDWLVNAPVIA
jgi:ParB/RepB/Spo0J family partition protein